MTDGNIREVLEKMVGVQREMLMAVQAFSEIQQAQTELLVAIAETSTDETVKERLQNLRATITTENILGAINVAAMRGGWDK